MLNRRMDSMDSLGIDVERILDSGLGARPMRILRESAETRDISEEMLTRAIEVTDTNAAFFDVANYFAGCIAGIHEVLRRQGLLASIRCLYPNACLSPGQMQETDRV